MPNDKEAVELQNKWNENRFEIIDRLDTLLLEELKKPLNGVPIFSKKGDPAGCTPGLNAELIGKLAPARLMFFQEFLTLAALGNSTDEVMNAYTFARGEGGNA